ncbi:MAG: TIGR02444 family protein [Asticcacaulis sp.]
MSDFWDWAVRAYGAPGVAEACLVLQDTHHQCVPLILFGAWAEARGYGLDAEVCEAAVDTARVWADEVITPLRTIRRRIKGPVSDMDAAARHDIREQIKATELGAEKALMVSLEALIDPEAPGGVRSENVLRLARHWAPVVPRVALNHLRARLSSGGYTSGI